MRLAEDEAKCMACNVTGGLSMKILSYLNYGNGMCLLRYLSQNVSNVDGVIAYTTWRSHLQTIQTFSPMHYVNVGIYSKTPST